MKNERNVEIERVGDNQKEFLKLDSIPEENVSFFFSVSFFDKENREIKDKKKIFENFEEILIRPSFRFLLDNKEENFSVIYYVSEKNLESEEDLKCSILKSTLDLFFLVNKDANELKLENY
jgi:hypothetical protein